LIQEKGFKNVENLIYPLFTLLQDRELENMHEQIFYSIVSKYLIII